MYLQDYIENTPPVTSQRLGAGQGNRLDVRLEGNNPAGSVPDRPARDVIIAVEAGGEIRAEVRSRPRDYLPRIGTDLAIDRIVDLARNQAGCRSVLTREQGIFCRLSSDGASCVARAWPPSGTTRKIVTIVCDRAGRHPSSSGFCQQTC